MDQDEIEMLLMNTAARAFHFAEKKAEDWDKADLAYFDWLASE